MGRRKQPVAERLARYKVDPVTGCWNWTLSLDHNGYGQLKIEIDGQTFHTAHRASYAFHVGPIPDGKMVLHKCPGNRKCIRPDHLYVGTASDNMYDRVRDGTDPHVNRTHCPQDHPLEGDNLRPDQLKIAKRACLTCSRERSREQSAVIMAAAKARGFTVRAYVASHGKSTKTARAIIAAAENSQTTPIQGAL